MLFSPEASGPSDSLNFVASECQMGAIMLKPRSLARAVKGKGLCIGIKCQQYTELM